MDTIWTTDSLVLFLIFFIPGFISQKIYRLIVADEVQDSASFVTSAVAYSSLNYALASPLIWWLAPHWRQVALGWLISATIFVMLLLPAVLPLVWLWIRSWPFVKNRTISPVKRPWDAVFGHRQRYWAIVTFKNGDKIAGVYGTSSHTSSFPAKEQIYLEKVWQLASDGTFDHELPGTKGAIILGDEIMTVELFKSS